jgi:hypothetical protein
MKERRIKIRENVTNRFEVENTKFEWSIISLREVVKHTPLA